MNKQQLFDQIKQKQSFLCIGLDTDTNKIPKHLRALKNPLFEFNKQIIEATEKFCIAYKPNLAFYEACGDFGISQLAMTVEYIRKNFPEQFIIADAKRGDIDNTSQMYARAFFDNMNFDAVTLSPYMGKDTVKPFLQINGKWAVLLALTSNKSSEDFQMIKTDDGKFVYEKVLEKSKHWGKDNQIMYVVGATKAELFQDIRKIVPNHFLLVPGVGAQGGNLADVAKFGMNRKCGLIVNSSRNIIYIDNTNCFAEKAGEKAKETQQEMAYLLNKYMK